MFPLFKKNIMQITKEDFQYFIELEKRIFNIENPLKFKVGEKCIFTTFDSSLSNNKECLILSEKISIMNGCCSLTDIKICLYRDYEIFIFSENKKTNSVGEDNLKKIE
jgi:hypothetical protein